LFRAANKKPPEGEVDEVKKEREPVVAVVERQKRAQKLRKAGY
jgi:hypothetical protein